MYTPLALSDMQIYLLLIKMLLINGTSLFCHCLSSCSVQDSFCFTIVYFTIYCFRLGCTTVLQHTQYTCIYTYIYIHTVARYFFSRIHIGTCQHTSSTNISPFFMTLIPHQMTLMLYDQLWSFTFCLFLALCRVHSV